MAEATAASKRVAALTGYMLAVLAVAGPAGLYRLDAESFRDDALALLTLQRLDRYLASHDPSSEQKPMRWASARALERSHPDLHGQMIAARQLLTDHLILGLGGHEPFGCEDFGRFAVEGKPVAEDRIAQLGWGETDPIDITFALLSVSSPWLERSRDTGTAARGTVAELLDRVADAQAPVSLRVAKSIALDPVPAVECPPTPAPGPQQLYREPGKLYFAGASLGDNAVIVRFEGTPQQQVQQQAYGLVEEVSIAAELSDIEGPPAAALIGEYGGRDSRLLGDDLERLAVRPSALTRLRTDYGYLPIDYAVSTAGAALVEGYAGATVFGLRVTARRLALVVSLAAIGISTALLAEAGVAKAAGHSLRDKAPDGLRAILASSTVGRIGVWSIAPAAAILLAAPLTGGWIAASAFAAGLGIAATVVAGLADHVRNGGPKHNAAPPAP